MTDDLDPLRHVPRMAVNLKPVPDTPRVSDEPAFVVALRQYQQADADGTMVLASRQAIEETITALAEREREVGEWKDKCETLEVEYDRLFAEKQAAEARVRVLVEFVQRVAENTDDCVSPGFKGEARKTLAALSTKEEPRG